MKTTTIHPILSLSTLVNIRRQVKSFPDQSPDGWGPMSIRDAVAAGHIGTSSGTVSVTVTVAEGEHAGANVYRSNGQWFAQYDPFLEKPDQPA